MRTLFCLLFVWSITTPFFAQLGGNSTYQFLNLISSPRQAALGGKIITNVDYDVTQGLYNPATINLEMDNQLALNMPTTWVILAMGQLPMLTQLIEEFKLFTQV